MNYQQKIPLDILKRLERSSSIETPMKTNAEGLLQIKLASLQIKMQHLASIFQTYVTMAYSVMIAIVLFLYGMAINLASSDFILAGIVVALVYAIASVVIIVWYSRKVNAIRNEIKKLEKQYEW